MHLKRSDYQINASDPAAESIEFGRRVAKDVRQMEPELFRRFKAALERERERDGEPISFNRPPVSERQSFF